VTVESRLAVSKNLKIQKLTLHCVAKMTKTDDSPKAEMKAPASPAINKIQKSSRVSPKRSPVAKNIFIRMLSPKMKTLESSPRKAHIPRLLRFGKGKTAKDLETEEEKENAPKDENKEDTSEDYFTSRTDWTDTATESTYFGCPSDGEEEEEDYEVDPSVISTFGFDVPQNRRHLTPKKMNVQVKQRSILQNGIQMIKKQSARHMKRTPQKVVPKEAEPKEEMLSMSVADKILEEWAQLGGAPLTNIPL
jgi:hypothetical protein